MSKRLIFLVTIIVIAFIFKASQSSSVHMQDLDHVAVTVTYEEPSLTMLDKANDSESYDKVEGEMGTLKSLENRVNKLVLEGQISKKDAEERLEDIRLVTRYEAFSKEMEMLFLTEDPEPLTAEQFDKYWGQGIELEKNDFFTAYEALQIKVRLLKLSDRDNVDAEVQLLKEQAQKASDEIRQEQKNDPRTADYQRRAQMAINKIKNEQGHLETSAQKKLIDNELLKIRLSVFSE